jgi:hypothetical protein
MTLAICMKCGVRKIGALTKCKNCEFIPVSEREVEISLILTDHFIRYQDLRSIGDILKRKDEIVLEYYFLSFGKRIAYDTLRRLGLTRLASYLLRDIRIERLGQPVPSFPVLSYSVFLLIGLYSLYKLLF